MGFIILLAAWSQLSFSLSTFLCFFLKILLNMGGHTKCVFISKNQHYFLVGWNPVHYTLPETNESPLRIKGWKMKWFLSEPGPWAHFSGAKCQTVSFREFQFHPRKKNLEDPQQMLPLRSPNLSTLPWPRFPWRSDRAKKRRKDRSRKRHRDRERPRDLEKEAVWPVGSGSIFGGSNLMLKCMVIVQGIWLIIFHDPSYEFMVWHGW